MTSLTMLADMMGRDLEMAVDRLRSLGIVHLDIKNHVFERSIEDLDDRRRDRLASLIDRTGTTLYCLSSSLGFADVSKVSEREFRTHLERGTENILATLAQIEASVVRLFACSLSGQTRAEAPERLPAWVFDSYRDVVKELRKAGVGVTIENEPDSVLSTPSTVHAFFRRLNLDGEVGYTWDIQNMWEAGTYPSVGAYTELGGIVNYVHVKGGRETADSQKALVYRSTLENASWPVADIVGRVLDDGRIPVLCINASHGEVPSDYEHARGKSDEEMRASEAVADVAFLRRTFPTQIA